MKLKFFSGFFILFTIFVLQSAINAQDGKKLKFTDDSELPVTGNFFGKEISSVKVFKKEIAAELSIKEIGKAVRFSDDLLNGLKKENAALGKKLKKITTAFGFTQGGENFYINAFDSFNEAALQNCDKCRVKIKLTILEICSGSSKTYVPVIENIEPEIKVQTKKSN